MSGRFERNEDEHVDDVSHYTSKALIRRNMTPSGKALLSG